MAKIIKRVLIAEDTFEWQKFHTRMLQSYDNLQLDFYVAESARDAVNIVEEHIDDGFVLVVTDLIMETVFLPDYAGEWLVKQLRTYKEYKNTPIVLVSATYNIAHIASALGCSAISKRALIVDPDRYFLMLDEKLLK